MDADAGPDVVRLDDLAAPEFSSDAQAMLDAMDGMAADCPLEADALCETAIAQSGLDDFGEPNYREPLDVLTAALRGEAGLRGAGVVSLHTQLVGFLVSRLRIVDLLRRHPEIHDIPIARPIIIVGLPRTGTTHLHNTMAADPALRSLPYWEASEPVLAAGDEPAPGAPDPRLERTELALGFLHEAAPHIDRMHEMTVGHAHEEIHLLATAISTMYFETMALMPSWRDWYAATDQTPYYAWLKTCLQVLTHLRGGDRWVLKSPQHLEQLGPLLATFPDATVVVTHRDPVNVVCSFATMVTYLMRLQVQTIDPRETGAYWADRIETLLNACMRDRAIVPADQSMDVRFAEFMADDRAMIRRVYELAAQPLSNESRAAIDGYLATHVRDRHGRVEYDLGALGLDRADLSTRLAEYGAHFGV